MCRALLSNFQNAARGGGQEDRLHSFLSPESGMPEPGSVRLRSLDEEVQRVPMPAVALA
jgi:hypothetical protein